MSKALFRCGPLVWKALNDKHNNGAAPLFAYVCACINKICVCVCGVRVDATIIIVLLLLLVVDIFGGDSMCWYMMSHASRYCLRAILSKVRNCQQEFGIKARQHQP